ncbi:polysaccharide deacetylase family protein [Rhodopseudomonas palustris]|uniref:Chitooligosaccharide deacetylase n=1 Tax=Rhodopseudomonas palustris (strain BisB18) TaxID=316056 RepID=Q21BJ1_RHOPB
MTMLSHAKARINNRLARLVGTTPFRLLNQKPMVSFTFDDVPKTAVTVGAEILKEYSSLGTFYVAGSLLDSPSPLWTAASGDDIVALHRDGHEIGCHTFSHRQTCDLDAAAMAAEIERNGRFLRSLDDTIRIENFAYPFGVAAVLRKSQLGTMFRSSRGIFPGVNSGKVDLQFLYAIPLISGQIDCDAIDRTYDEALRCNGWVVFYGHDVAASPSPYGCSPQLLRHALEAASRRNIQALTMSQALSSAGA